MDRNSIRALFRTAPGAAIAIALALAGAGWPVAAAAQQAALSLTGTGAVLQGLDKVTAAVTTFTAPLDTVVRFGSLDITVRACHKAPPTEPPEKTAFLEVDETNPKAGEARIYSGWMYASSPALAALEHPVYDVWVIDCMNASNSAGGNSP